MVSITYNLTLTDDGHVRVKVTKKNPDHVYIIGKTRAQVTRDVLFFLRVTDVPVNKDRLQDQLDDLIWKYVPKHKWY
jgi:hypothetical protein